MADETETRSRVRPRIRLWDIPTRLFHWSLVILFGVSFYTGENGPMDIHQISGITILVLVLFRILWGLVGSTTARFASFLRGPGAVFGYVRALLRRDPPHTAGHNPLGGWVVMAMLVLVGAQASLGLFANDDLFFEGPLAWMVDGDTSTRLTDLHHDLFGIILIVVIVHIVAVVGYLVLLRENLIGPMVTGRKAVDADEARRPLKFAHPALALVALSVAGGFVWWLLQ
ncbi:MAG: cytochrome b/b6 domain-containing protein [Sphingomonadales bacterium]